MNQSRPRVRLSHAHHACVAVLALVFLAASAAAPICGAASAPRAASELGQRLGLVWGDDTTFYFATERRSLTAGTAVTAISLGPPTRQFALTIVGVDRRARQADPVIIDGADSTTVYRVTGVRFPDDSSTVCLGVVGLRHRARRLGRVLAADLDDDGTPEQLTSCTGIEGFNVRVRSPGTRRLLWHAYYYFGFEVEASDCTDDDVR